jgi:TubC N-terminal docking domain
MNPALEVLSEIQRRGVTLLVRDGKLIARPISAVPPDLAERARQHRAEIIRLLHCPPDPETVRSAGLEADRNARDRLPKRGYDNDPSAPGHSEYLDWIALRDRLEPARSLIRTCREYGVGLRLEPDGTLVVESNGRAWRSLVRAIEAHVDAVAQLIEARWDSNDA